MSHTSILFRIIAIICLASQISVAAEIIRLSFLQDPKTGKRVAILHDRHYVHTNVHLASGEDAKELQLKQLNEIKDIFPELESDPSSALCIAELLKISESEKKMIQQGLIQRPKLGTVLEGITEYVEKNKAFHQNLSFKECNERHFFDSLHLNLLINRDLAKGYKELNDKWQKEDGWDKPFYILTGPEVGGFLNFITHRRDSFFIRVNKLAIPEEAKKGLVNDIQNNFKNMYAIGQAIISQSNNLDLNSTMLDCFLAAEDHELLSLTHAVASESSNAFDIPLLETVIESTEKRVIVCAGDFHASLLAKRLVDSGLEMVQSQASMPIGDFKGVKGFVSKRSPTKAPANIASIILSFFRGSPKLDTVEVTWHPTIAALAENWEN